jgi:hypothetical protein
MNLRELVDYIHSGPANLMLDKPLRFHPRTPSNPSEFNELLQALQSSETIRRVTCRSQVLFRITEYQWVLLVQALGRIHDIQYLEFSCTPGSRDFHPFQAVADAVTNAQSLLHLRFATNLGSFPREPSGLTALANALGEHTGLQEFSWSGMESPRRSRDPNSLDPVLWVLPACLHLRRVFIGTKYASADAMKHLLQLHSTTYLHLVLHEQEHLLAVADEIRRGRCNVQMLTLHVKQETMVSSGATQAATAVASAIRSDQTLEYLYLRMHVADEAGVALAEALTVNQTLRRIDLSVCKSTLSTHAYEALSAMLRVNTSIKLDLPPFELAGADERLCESRQQVRMEQRLNQVGRGRLLASRQTISENYVDALNELNSCNVDEFSSFQVGCLYSLLRLHPAVCMS